VQVETTSPTLDAASNDPNATPNLMESLSNHECCAVRFILRQAQDEGNAQVCIMGETAHVETTFPARTAPHLMRGHFSSNTKKLILPQKTHANIIAPEFEAVQITDE
jgi:hypothetical protein